MQRFLCWGFFLALGGLRGVFHGVGVVVVGFSCFSALRVVLQDLIVATSAGSGCNNSNNNFFSVLLLELVFLNGALCMVFE